MRFTQSQLDQALEAVMGSVFLQGYKTEGGYLYGRAVTEAGSLIFFKRHAEGPDTDIIRDAYNDLITVGWLEFAK